MRKVPSISLLFVALIALSVGTQGCLSSNYRIPDAEMERLVRLDPDTRARKVRVEQRTFFNSDPESDAPVREPGSYEEGYEEGYYDSHSNVYVSSHVHVPVRVHRVRTRHGVTRVSRVKPNITSGGGGVAHAAAPGGSAVTAPSAGSGVVHAPAPEGAGGVVSGASPTAPSAAVGADATGTPAGVAQPAPPSQAASSGGAAGSGSSGGGSGTDIGGIEDAAAAIIIAAAAVTVGLVATEGMRYDGWVQLHPDHPVHLLYNDGYEEIVPLSALEPGDVGRAEAVIVEEEGEVWMLGRAPLDRQGFAWRMEGGVFELTTPDDQFAIAPAATIQAGFFPLQWLGLMFTTSIAGTSDRGGKLLSWQYGLEADLMPLSLGPVHAGVFGATLMGFNAAEGGPFNDYTFHESAYHAGALAEFELTTRMALSLRAGAYWQNREDQMLPMTWLATGGVSIY